LNRYPQARRRNSAWVVEDTWTVEENVRREEVDVDERTTGRTP
jgi:stress response protein YsnF